MEEVAIPTSPSRQLFQRLLTDCYVGNGELLQSLLDSTDHQETLRTICDWTSEPEDELEPGRTLLHCCVCNETNPDVAYRLSEQLIQLNPQLVTVADAKGATCLHLCAANKAHLDARLVELLLQNGAAASCREAVHGYTPLHLAILNANVKVAVELVKHKEAIFVTDKWGATPLHCAVQGAADAELVQPIMDAVSVDERVRLLQLADSSGNRALDLAVSRNSAQAIRLMLAALDADAMNGVLELRDANGRTPFLQAVSEGHEKACEVLVECCTPDQINAQDPESKRSPLHYAAMKNHISVAQILLRSGGAASVTLGNAVNDLPIHEAASNGHSEMVRLLLDDEHVQQHQQTTIHALSNSKRAPLHYAVGNGHDGVVRVLIEHSVDVNQVGYSELADRPFTALDISEDWPTCRQLLMEAGAMSYGSWEKIHSKSSRPATAKSMTVEWLPDVKQDAQGTTEPRAPEATNTKTSAPPSATSSKTRSSVMSQRNSVAQDVANRVSTPLEREVDPEDQVQTISLENQDYQEPNEISEPLEIADPQEPCVAESPSRLSLKSDPENAAAGSPSRLSLKSDPENAAAGSPSRLSLKSDPENAAAGSPSRLSLKADPENADADLLPDQECPTSPPLLEARVADKDVPEAENTIDGNDLPEAASPNQESAPEGDINESGNIESPQQETVDVEPTASAPASPTEPEEEPASRPTSSAHRKSATSKANERMELVADDPPKASPGPSRASRRQSAASEQGHTSRTSQRSARSNHPVTPRSLTESRRSLEKEDLSRPASRRTTSPTAISRSESLDSHLQERSLSEASVTPFDSEESQEDQESTKIDVEPFQLQEKATGRGDKSRRPRKGQPPHKAIPAATSQRIIQDVRNSVAQFEYIRLIGRAAHYRVRQQVVRQVAVSQSGDNFHRVYHQMLQDQLPPKSQRSRRSPRSSPSRSDRKSKVEREKTHDSIPSQSSPRPSKRLLSHRPEAVSAGRGNSLMFHSSPYAQPQVVVRKLA